uniref:Phage integrase family protein n=1 Tax=Candidatus Kentrum sp. MB TaxID=2138164 RepID=A0A450Y3P3_9GAMM|nr:MAG: Phage integrase family protein [Candidatus Kentron sp. MB]VFK36072.1 MAG: Phage integrase family protein [Candidatus Kentron sp. MB]VFK77623.1 MAG: Phage integrase family protein [Candidatus Kentron sp. MB]
MAAFRKIGTRHRADVCCKGQRRSRTFRTKAEAKQWALETEIELESGKKYIGTKTVADLLDRYVREVSVKKRGYLPEKRRIRRLRLDSLATVQLSLLSPSHVTAWREKRLTEISSGSVLKGWNLLHHVFNTAARKWEWLDKNPMTTVKRPAPNPPRTRLVADREVELMIYGAGYSRESAPETIAARMCAAWLFALETAMRAGEIVGIRPEDDRQRYVHLPTTKNGNPRDVPLSKEARRLLDQVKGDFRLTSNQIDRSFRRVRDRVGIDGLTFHDSRATALTRLSGVLDVLDLAKVSGHKDLRILLNTYYRVTADDLADKINRGAPPD